MLEKTLYGQLIMLQMAVDDFLLTLVQVFLGLPDKYGNRPTAPIGRLYR